MSVVLRRLHLQSKSSLLAPSGVLLHKKKIMANPSSDMAAFRSLAKKAKHIVVLTGQVNIIKSIRRTDPSLFVFYTFFNWLIFPRA